MKSRMMNLRMTCLLGGFVLGFGAVVALADAPPFFENGAEQSVAKQIQTPVDDAVSGEFIGDQQTESNAIPAAGTSTIVPQPSNVCYGFTTVAQGLISYFGYYCGGPISGVPPLSSADQTPPCYARLAQPKFEAVIRDECAWLDFWTQHTSGLFPPPPPPVIDFDRYVVIVVISGPRPDGCYGIQIPAVVGDSCGTKVLVREIVPCYGQACPDVVSNPYHIIKICKQFVPYDRPLCFEHRYMSPNCVVGVFCPDIDPGAADDGQ